MRLWTLVLVSIFAAGAGRALASAAGDALSAAAGAGDVPGVQRLLERDRRAISARDNDGRTALHAAALSDQAEICRLLIENGADVNARGNDGAVPLTLAVAKGNVNAARVLVQHGAELYAMTGEGNAPIHEAVHAGRIDAVRFLLASGTTVDTPNADGDTPLIVAARSGWPDVAKLLLAAGAKISARNRAGSSAADEAKRVGKADVCGLLDAFQAASDTKAAAETARLAAGLALRPSFAAWEKSDAVAQVVYGSAFTTGKVGREWSMVAAPGTALPVAAAANATRRYAGELGNQTVLLTLTGLPAHKELSLGFDLLVLRGWGCGAAAPEVWSVGIEGGPTLLQTSFYNPPPVSDYLALKLQAFPGEFPGSRNPGYTDAFERNSLGCTARVGGHDYPMDAVYRLGFTFAHSASTVTFAFSARGLDAAAKVGWGLDDVRVSVPAQAGVGITSAYPAHATTGAIGSQPYPRRASSVGLLRRRRSAVRLRPAHRARTLARRVTVHPVRIHARKEAPAP